MTLKPVVSFSDGAHGGDQTTIGEDSSWPNSWMPAADHLPRRHRYDRATAKIYNTITYNDGATDPNFLTRIDKTIISCYGDDYAACRSHTIVATVIVIVPIVLVFTPNLIC